MTSEVEVNEVDFFSGITKNSCCN